MRLLDISEYPKIRFRDVANPRCHRYAILSHVQNRESDAVYIREPTFQDVSSIIASSGTLPLDDAVYGKLHRVCELASRQGYKLVWADICCIDRTSSSELSEAIASMYNWYRRADVCYAYLKDVSASANRSRDPELVLLDSIWFKRGWTLQELLAPRVVVFLDMDWTALGTKTLLANHITSITGIHQDVLTRKQSVHEVSVAQRMSWAAHRGTARPEDQAYCLMGLFGVRIPVMYGEGTYAFIRLQEEILRSIPDPSLLAWGKHCDSDNLFSLGFAMGTPLDPISPPPSFHTLPPPSAVHVDRYSFAASPDDFALGGYGQLSIRPVKQNPSKLEKPFPFQVVPCHILRMQTPLIALYPAKSTPSWREKPLPAAYLALLECRTRENDHVALLLSVKEFSNGPLLYVGNLTASLEVGDSRDLAVTRIVTINPVDIPAIDPRNVVDVYVPVSAPRIMGDTVHTGTEMAHRALCENSGEFFIQIPEWCPVTLATSKYSLVQVGSHTEPAYLLSLPVGDEACPHGPSRADPEICETRASNPLLDKCPESSGVLRISFGNCDHSSCRTRRRTDTVQVHSLWGNIRPDSAPSPATTATPPATRTCEGGAKSHVLLWTLQDGVASKTFTFHNRRMPKDNTTLAVSESGAAQANDALPLQQRRAEAMQVTLTLKQMPSEGEYEVSNTFFLDIDVNTSKVPPQSTSSQDSTPMPQSLRHDLVLDTASILTTERSKPSPLTRRNSDASLLGAPTFARRPSHGLLRSASFTRKTSVEPPLPEESSVFAFSMGPAKDTQTLAAPDAGLAGSDSLTRERSVTPPLFEEFSVVVPPMGPPDEDTQALVAPAVHPSPLTPAPLPPAPGPPAPGPPAHIPVQFTASAPPVFATVAGPSTQSPDPAPEHDTSTIPAEPVRTPEQRNGLDTSKDRSAGGVSQRKFPLGRTDGIPHPETSPGRNRMVGAAIGRIRRIFSKLGRSRPENTK